jgi:colanic acid/amylovoran biosynthesis protein
MNERRPSPIALVGASLAANKGAAAMLETVITVLPTFVGPCRFSVLSTFPDEDAERFRTNGEVEVADLRPLRLMAVEIPLAATVALSRKLRLPAGWLPRTPVRTALEDARLVVDVAGISFSDGRGLPILVYNVLMTGLGLLYGRPTVKAAQALGPFDQRSTRLAARLVLPRLRWIGARGAATRRNLERLELANVTEVADLAFSLHESAALPDAVEAAVPSDHGFCVVMPSAVVRKLAERDGVDYVDAVAELVRELRTSTGLAVVIAPHSYRAGRPEDRMNDGPVCREVARRVDDDQQVVLIDRDLDAAELRTLIHRSSLLVTSRFHAMISGLATATPTVVVGWSHKYREVLDEFGLARFGVDHRALADPQSIVDLANEALADSDRIRDGIQVVLPAVRQRSLDNFVAMEQVLSRGAAAPASDDEVVAR